jgi:hypothetical protein
VFPQTALVWALQTWSEELVLELVDAGSEIDDDLLGRASCTVGIPSRDSSAIADRCVEEGFEV